MADTLESVLQRAMLRVRYVSRSESIEETPVYIVFSLIEFVAAGDRKVPGVEPH